MKTLTDNQLIYRAYLASPLWKAKRQQALEHYGCICMRCGEYGSDVHHKTYERVGGNELMEDFEVLCRDCHEAHHRAERYANPRRRFKSRSIHRRAILPSLSGKMRREICAKFNIRSLNLYAEINFGKRDEIALEAIRLLGFDKIIGKKLKKRAHKPMERISRRIVQHPYYYGVAFIE